METTVYNQFKKDFISHIGEEYLCREGVYGITGAQNIYEFLNVVKRYWSSMLMHHRNWALPLMEKYYPQIKEDANRHGIFFNESSDFGLVLLNNSSEISIGGNAEVYAIGNSKYKASEHVRVYAYDESAGSIEGYAKAVLNDNASCEAYGFSSVTANGNNTVLADGAVTVYAGGTSNVKALRWKRIIGTGNSKILAPIKRNIELSGNSTYSKLI